MSEKHYKNIREVSELLNIKEHVIRHWDSIDPKTKKIRIQGLSIRSKGGTRYFGKENIKKLEQLKNLLFENGKHNYSLDLANKILTSNKSLNKNINIRREKSINNSVPNNKLNLLNSVINKLKKLDNL